MCRLEGRVAYILPAYLPAEARTKSLKIMGRCNKKKIRDQNDGISKFVLDPNWETHDGSIPIEWGFNLMDPILMFLSVLVLLVRLVKTLISTNKKSWKLRFLTKQIQISATENPSPTHPQTFPVSE